MPISISPYARIIKLSDTSTRAAAIQAATDQVLRSMQSLDADWLNRLHSLYTVGYTRISSRFYDLSQGDHYVRLHHLERVLVWVDEVLQNLALEQRDLLDTGLSQSAALGASVLSRAQFEQAALADATSAVRAVWHLQQSDGLQLSDRIWRLEVDTKKFIRDAIMAALVQGNNALEAARDFAYGGLAIPADISAASTLASISHLSSVTSAALLTGQGSALYNAQRLFRTEMARAQTFAYIDAMESMGEDSGLIGYRFRLGANHKKVDICDVHAGANLYGLGRGVYPSRVIRKIYPAHPNTTSYIQAVFEEELKESDAQRDKSRVEYLRQQSITVQDQVLGKQKAQWLREGKLTDDMINLPVSVLAKRLEQ